MKKNRKKARAAIYPAGREKRGNIRIPSTPPNSLALCSASLPNIFMVKGQEQWFSNFFGPLESIASDICCIRDLNVLVLS